MIKSFNIFTLVVLVSCGTAFLAIQYPKWYPELTEISYQPVTALNEDWELNVTTTNYYPASWKLAEPKLIFNEKTFKLIIVIRARYRGYTLIPALWQLRTIIKLVFQLTGNWTVQCNNQIFTVQVI